MTSQGQLIKPHWRTENYGTYCLFSDQASAILESHPHSHNQKPASTASTSRAMPYRLHFTPRKWLPLDTLPLDTPKASDWDWSYKDNLHDLQCFHQVQPPHASVFQMLHKCIWYDKSNVVKFRLPPPMREMENCVLAFQCLQYRKGTRRGGRKGC